jgi:hypothetical protein
MLALLLLLETILLTSSLYFQANKAFKRVDVDKKKEDIEKVKTKYGLDEEK